MDWIEMLKIAGPAAAPLVVLVWITNRFLLFMGNHLSQANKVQASLSEALRDLTASVSRLNGRLAERK